MNSQISFMPRWVVGTLLLFALLLFILAITLYSSPVMFILATVCFLPCYVAMYMDAAKRRLPFHWAMLLLYLPFLGAYIYFLIRDKITRDFRSKY